MHKLSIIVPCYNESRTIEEILRRILAVSISGWEREIIVVDDGSTDGTRDILRSCRLPIAVISQEKNGGKGTAVRRGLEEATGHYVLIQDADLEYEPEDIPTLLSALGKAQVIYGSRNLRPRERQGAWMPRLGVWFLTKMINILYGLRLTDVWTGYKLFPREAAGDFIAGHFESELLFTAALARRKYSFIEVPISYTPRPFSEGKKIRYRDGISAIMAIITDWIINK